MFFTGGDYTEQQDWLTDVMTSPTGNSMHRRLRQWPRVYVSTASLEGGRTRRRMEALLRDNAAGVWRIPVAVDACLLEADAAAGATVLSLDATHARFAVGSHVLVRGADPLTVEVARIASGGVSDSALTLDAGLANDWPAGTTVTPLRSARLAEFPQVGRFTSDETAVVDLKFLLIEPLDDPSAIGGGTYRSFPVWPWVPVWTSDPVWVPERNLQTVDYDFAPPVYHDLAHAPQGRTTMQYAAETRADCAAFRSALAALAGRWTPVWVPSWNSDARIVSDVADGATSIDIESPVFADLDLPNNQRDLRIALWDGTVLYRRVVSVTTPAAGIERLTLDSAIATGFSASAVQLVSHLTLCVQDADTNLLRYWTRDVMECELTWRQLAHGL